MAKTVDEFGRMLGGFIKYLHRSNFKDRGRHNPDDDPTSDAESE